MLQGMVGPYRILSTVGAGGMGIVYKAIDTRLNRAVAIKAIQGRTPADESAVERLRAEALAAAGLDHPYICKIYELVETGHETLIVMEFVEGQTLRALLRQAKPSIEETIQFGAEIAEGLANAHERGLVHRDVKPANVMITSHRHIKLLDFGLAHESSVSAPDADTRLLDGGRGVAAGTPAYMAPEQALGEPLTASADLFSLGVVLFECLAGELPFEGTTEYTYARSLIQNDPKPLGRLAPDAPPELVRLIGQCLSKDPTNRPETAAAVARHLHLIGDLASSRSSRTAVRVADLRRRRWRAWQAGLAVAAVAAVLLFIFGPWRRGASPDTTTGQQMPIVTWPSEESDSRSSPDGRFVSFVSNRDGHVGLFVQSIDGGDAQIVRLPPGDLVSHVWSPDGREFACLMQIADGLLLEIIPAPFGGAARQNVRLALATPSPRATRLLRWIGNTVYLQNRTGTPSVMLRRVDLGQAQTSDISSAWKVAGDVRGFDVAPGGERVVFSMFANEQEDLWTARLDGSSAVQLTADRFFERDPIWADPETVIFQSNRGGQVDLWAMTVADRRSWPLTSSQVEDVPNGVSADGSIITFQQVSQNANLWAVNPSTGGNGEQLTADALSDFSPTASDDGRTIVFQRTRPRLSEGVPLLDSTLMRGSVGERGLEVDSQPVAEGFAPRLSPDGQRLAYLQRPASQTPSNILRVKDLRTGTSVTVSEHVLPPGFSVQSPFDWTSQTVAWTPDGRSVLFIENSTDPVIRRFRTETNAVDAPLVRASPGMWIRELYPAPDGATFVYLAWSRAEKQSELHVFDPASSSDRIAARLPADVWTDVQIKGWAQRGGPVILIRLGPGNADHTHPVEVLAAYFTGAVGTPRRLASIDRAFFATMRLDPDRSTLYVSKSDGLVQNLYGVSLASGVQRRLSNNQLPAVSFAGVQRFSAGRLMYVRDQKRQDIWVIRRAEPARR